MQRNDTMIVAHQGWPYLGAAVVAFVLFVLLDWGLFQFLAFVTAALIVYIYRNPERIVPHYQEHSIVAMADGRIRSIETVDASPLLAEPCYKVELTSSVFHTSLLRMPFEGKVMHLELRRGSRLSTLRPLAQKLNERACIAFENDQNQRCAIEHLLDQSIDALSITTHEEEHLHQGSRYGLVVKGDHTLYLPLQSRVAVKVGDDVRAGETLIGYFS